MIQYTKENPGGPYSMLKYLSEISGISLRKELEFDSMDKLRRKNGSKTKSKSYLIYNAYDIKVVINGEIIPYMIPGPSFGDWRFDNVYKDTPEKFIVTVDRSYEEFGIEIKPAGTYNDSLGGGWSSKIDLYNINGNYFAPDMEV